MNITECQNCSKPLKETASFCGKCKTQVKCLNCKESIALDDICCENCGTDVPKKNVNAGVLNKIRFQENSEGRFFEAEFTDEVGKDLTGTLGEILTARQLALGGFEKPTSSGNDSSTIPENRQEKTTEDVQFEDASELVQNNNAHPKLQSVVMNNLPANEAEWIVVYSFYASNFGEDKFTRQDILNLYGETDRKTDSRMKNFTSYLNSVIKSNSINPINNKGDFSLLASGKQRAIEIIHRTTSSPVKNSRKLNEEKPKTSSQTTNTKTDSKSNKKASSSTDELKVIADLDLKELKEFVNQHKASSNFEKNLVFTYYLKEVLKLSEPISYNHIYSCYRWLDLKFPNAFVQSIRDTKGNKGWLNYSSMSDIKVSPKGMNHIKDLKIA